MPQSGFELRTSESLGIPSDRLLIVPTLESCFTTFINKLSVKHTIGQQMISFHGFLDLTDELFTDVVQKKRRGGVEKEKTKKILKVSHTSMRA